MSVLGTQLAMPRLRGVKRPTRSRRSPTVTGLEIGATQAIAAQSSLKDGRIVVERAEIRPFPLGLIRDGLVVDSDGLAHELKEMFAEHKLPKAVRVGLATPRTVLRVIDLPPLDEKDIRAALMMQAQERIPMPLERAVMDFQTVGLVDTPEGRRLRVIVVVTEREGVETLLDALRRAGLKPAGIDLSIFAVIRALRVTPQVEGPVLYAQLGDLANIAIAESGVCRFTRQAPQGLAMLLERAAESMAIPVDEALELVRRAAGKLPAAEADDTDKAIARLMERTASELGSELRAAAEFYSHQFGSEPVTTGIVAGPLAPLPGFVSALAAASGLEITAGEVATGESAGDVDARLMPLAGGLAVGELTS